MGIDSALLRPIGLTIYYVGHKQSDYDSLWRKGFRSVAHCYPRCGAGEVTEILIAVDPLALANLHVIALTFGLAYAHFIEMLFWSSLIFSLTMGLIAAYPVNLALTYFDVKENMMNPRRTRSDVNA